MRAISSFRVHLKKLRALLLLATLCVSAHAERLPLKYYTVADGLAHNTINKIVRDSRGFLWFCTQEGLSRFDAYAFTNYGTAQGLPHANVNDILEAGSGDYWVATNGGLVRFNPKGVPAARVVVVGEAPAEAQPMFTVVVPADDDRRARVINVLLEGRDGTLWCGTEKGLYRLDADGGRLALVSVDVGMPGEYAEQRYVNDLAEDRSGALWVATPSGLYRRWPGGDAARYTRGEGLPDNHLHDLLIDHEGRLWVGTRNAGLFRLDFNETHAPPSVAFALNTHDYLQSEWINQLFETSDHRLWAGIAHGLLELTPEGDAEGRPYHIYRLKNGLSDDAITALAEDTGGNLWLGSGQGGGVMKLARDGFVTYDRQDGVMFVTAIFEDRAGAVCFRGYVLGDDHASVFDGGRLDLLNLSGATYWQRFGRFDGQHLTWFLPDSLKGKNLGWVGEGVTLQTRGGEWWAAMGFEEGLYRFPAVDDFTQIKRARPLAVFGQDSVLGARQIFRTFEDSRGRVWVSTIYSTKLGNGLALWEPESQHLRDLTGSANLPAPADDLARSFGEDRAGGVWVGFNTGLARYGDGAFTFFDAKDGLPPGGIVDIHTDAAGRLWLASARGGLVRVDDPTSPRPAFTSYTTEQGLSGNVASALGEDLYGRIYVGTGQGLDRLDPATGRVKHYTTADGLAGGKIFAIFQDRTGHLWVGTSQGVSRFLPEPERQTQAPPVLVTSLSVSGTRQNISALGESELSLADLPAGSSQLQIDFVGLGFAPGESLRYQYMLEGADKDWGAQTTHRAVTYANLAPGRYRFLVRAVNSDGVVSAAPAAVTFTILPPVWMRWWFALLVLLAAGGVAYALYRYRVARLLEVADMRTRIATDLHDDIGANLTRIAILSEVAKRQFGNGSEQQRPNPLVSIADIARESVASMGDIVWAINPERDSLHDLTRRMRQHAEEVFALRDIELEFKAPGPEQHLKLGAGVRRDLLLIFKEAVNNAARHADCSRVRIDFVAGDAGLSLTVADDGNGFDLAAAGEGHGLTSMRQRARKLKGTLEIDAAEGVGTTVRLRVSHARTPPV